MHLYIASMYENTCDMKQIARKNVVHNDVSTQNATNKSNVKGRREERKILYRITHNVMKRLQKSTGLFTAHFHLLTQNVECIVNIRNR